MCSFTYSKSPGLLSMPTLGGAIQPAYLPGSIAGLHQRLDEIAIRLGGQPFVLALASQSSAAEMMLPSGSTAIGENTPIWR